MSIVQNVTQPQLWNTGPSALSYWWKPSTMHEDELSFDLDSIIEVISEHSRRHVDETELPEAVVSNAFPLVDALNETVVEPMESSHDEPITAVEQIKVELPQGIFTLAVVPSTIIYCRKQIINRSNICIYRSTHLGLTRYKIMDRMAVEKMSHQSRAKCFGFSIGRIGTGKAYSSRFLGAVWLQYRRQYVHQPLALYDGKYYGLTNGCSATKRT